MQSLSHLGTLHEADIVNQRAFVMLVLYLFLFLQAVFCKDTGTFWQFNDFNVDLDYIIEDNRDFWGKYGRDTSTLAAFTGIEKGNDEGYAENAPDFVIWGGGSRTKIKSQNESELQRSITWLSYHFKHAYNPEYVPLLPILGEGDFISSSKEPKIEELQQWCTTLAGKNELWYIWVHMAQQSVEYLDGFPKANFSTECYHALALKGDKMRIVLGLNSLVWSRNNGLAKPSVEDPLGQFKWITQALSWARANKASVFIVTYLPVGMSEQSAAKGLYMYEKYNDKLVDLLRDYSDVIVTTLAAHEHLDTFRVILDNRQCPVGTVFLTPAVSSVNVTGVGSPNPRIRRYNYSRTEGLILDYQQYWLDISHKHPSWKREYGARNTYKLTNLCAKEMAGLIDKFTTEDDPQNHWSDYWIRELGSRPHERTPVLDKEGNCPKAQSTCRCQHVCGMRHVDSISLIACSNLCPSNSTLRTIGDLCTNDALTLRGKYLWLFVAFTCLRFLSN